MIPNEVKNDAVKPMPTFHIFITCGGKIGSRARDWIIINIINVTPLILNNSNTAKESQPNVLPPHVMANDNDVIANTIAAAPISWSII